MQGGAGGYDDGEGVRRVLVGNAFACVGRCYAVRYGYGRLLFGLG